MSTPSTTSTTSTALPPASGDGFHARRGSDTVPQFREERFEALGLVVRVPNEHTILSRSNRSREIDVDALIAKYEAEETFPASRFNVDWVDDTQTATSERVVINDPFEPPPPVTSASFPERLFAHTSAYARLKRNDVPELLRHAMSKSVGGTPRAVTPSRSSRPQTSHSHTRARSRPKTRESQPSAPREQPFSRPQSSVPRSRSQIMRVESELNRMFTDRCKTGKAVVGNGLTGIGSVLGGVGETIRPLTATFTPSILGHRPKVILKKIGRSAGAARGGSKLGGVVDGTRDLPLRNAARPQSVGGNPRGELKATQEQSSINDEADGVAPGKYEVQAAFNYTRGKSFTASLTAGGPSRQAGTRDLDKTSGANAAKSGTNSSGGTGKAFLQENIAAGPGYYSPKYGSVRGKTRSHTWSTRPRFRDASTVEFFGTKVSAGGSSGTGWESLGAQNTDNPGPGYYMLRPDNPRDVLARTFAFRKSRHYLKDPTAVRGTANYANVGPGAYDITEQDIGGGLGAGSVISSRGSRAAGGSGTGSKASSVSESKALRATMKRGHKFNTTARFGGDAKPHHVFLLRQMEAKQRLRTLRAKSQIMRQTHLRSMSSPLVAARSVQNAAQNSTETAIRALYAEKQQSLERYVAKRRAKRIHDIAAKHQSVTESAFARRARSRAAHLAKIDRIKNKRHYDVMRKLSQKAHRRGRLLQRKWMTIVALMARTEHIRHDIVKARTDRRLRLLANRMSMLLERYAARWLNNVRKRKRKRAAATIIRAMKLHLLRMNLRRKRRAAKHIVSFCTFLKQRRELVDSFHAYHAHMSLLQRSFKSFMFIKVQRLQLLFTLTTHLESRMAQAYKTREGTKVFEKLQKRGLLKPGEDAKKCLAKSIEAIPYPYAKPEELRKILLAEYDQRRLVYIKQVRAYTFGTRLNAELAGYRSRLLCEQREHSPCDCGHVEKEEQEQKEYRSHKSELARTSSGFWDTEEDKLGGGGGQFIQVKVVDKATPATSASSSEHGTNLGNLKTQLVDSLLPEGHIHVEHSHDRESKRGLKKPRPRTAHSQALAVWKECEAHRHGYGAWPVEKMIEYVEERFWVPEGHSGAKLMDGSQYPKPFFSVMWARRDIYKLLMQHYIKRRVAKKTRKDLKRMFSSDASAHSKQLQRWVAHFRDEMEMRSSFQQPSNGANGGVEGDNGAAGGEEGVMSDPESKEDSLENVLFMPATGGNAEGGFSDAFDDENDGLDAMQREANAGTLQVAVLAHSIARDVPMM